MSTNEQMQKFHSEDYVDFLSKISPDNMKMYTNLMQKHNVGEYTDCPVFDGLYEFCQLYTGEWIQVSIPLLYFTFCARICPCVLHSFEIMFDFFTVCVC
jgi:acetoin utilization deacetylase AcuC-like enzyme